MDFGEPWGDHVGAGNVGEIPRLSHGGDQQHSGHAFESTRSHDVLGPPPSHGLKRNRKRRILVDLPIRLHQAKRNCQNTVRERGDHHGPNQPNGDISGRVLGFLGHRRDGVEPDVGEEEDGGGDEDAADAVRGEGGEVLGVGFGEAGDDDEEDDGDVDDGGDVVEAGGALGAGHGHDADHDDHAHGDGVQLVVVVGQGRGVDAEIVWVAVAEGREV